MRLLAPSLSVFVLLCAEVFFSSGCAYHFGRSDRIMPGDYRLFAIPIFSNLSAEPGIEVSFTNALLKEFEKSKVGRVVTPDMAEVEVLGEITSVRYTPEGEIAYNIKTNPGFPVGTSLATQYTIAVTTKLKMRKISDKSVIWTGTITRDTPYKAPQVTQVGVSTVNPIYNLSARRQKIEGLANDMMSEAYDNMTEKF